MCKIDLKIDFCVAERIQEGSGSVGGGCALASILLSTLFLPYSPYSVTWERKNVEHYEIQINGAKCTFIYKKGTEREDPNFASFLVPFSSFCKKKESLLYRSVPLNRS